MGMGMVDVRDPFDIGWLCHFTNPFMDTYNCKTLVDVCLLYGVNIRLFYKTFLENYDILKSVEICIENKWRMPKEVKSNPFNKDIRFYIIRRSGNVVYCFDENQTVQSVNIVDAYIMGLYNGVLELSLYDICYQLKKNKKYYGKVPIDIFRNTLMHKMKNGQLNYNGDGRYYKILDLLKDVANNREALRKSLQTLKVGDTIDDLKVKYDALKDNTYKKQLKSIYDENMGMNMYRFIQRIDVKDCKYPETPKEMKTFDFLEIWVITPMYFDHTNEFLIKFKKEFLNEISKHVSKSRSFTKYGIPINFLKITQFVITKDHSIRIVMELKEI